MMRLVATALGAALLAGCAGTDIEPGMAPDGPITDAATFRREIAGRPLSRSTEGFIARAVLFENGVMTVQTLRKDGTLVSRVEGAWRFENGQFCRDLTVVAGASSAPRSA